MALTATDLFNDATTREIGGVGPDQVNLIVSDLIGVQQMLSAADPQINNLSDLHTHVIINQLNEEIASVENANAPTTGTLTAGTDLGQYVGRSINDIHRDIIDIAQGDPGVQALFNPTPLPALNTPAAPFHDNAAQTTFITQWIQDSNHLGQMATTIENNGFNGDIAGLVQQIQTYATNSNAFDQAQGGLWSARFWNEFRSDGTSGTAASALVEGLQTHNAGEVNAATQQLAANSADVASNNVMTDGGSYANVVAEAQATAVTPNNPAGGETTPPAAPAFATDRATALGQTTDDLGQAGLIFNDAVRLSNGGLWSQPADDHNQLNYASMYEADISILQQDIASALANGATVNGVAVTPSNANTLTEIQGQLAQLAQAAPNAVGTSAAAAQAQGVLHTNEQLILGEIAGDANLQNALAANGVANGGTGAIDQGFQALPAQAADDAAAITAATAGANLSDIGAVFNAATNLSNGGLNASNITQFDNDMKATATGLQNFISGGGLAAAQADTAAEQALATAEGITLSQAQALTGVHVQTMLDQVQDQIARFDGMYAVNPNIAARSTNDNLLDIIDIVQGDPALAASAGNATGNPGHAGGFAEQPGYLTGTVQHYQDNQAQTDFWSAFVAGANNLNNALTAEANGTVHLDTAGVQSLIQQVQGYQQLGNSFDAAQGGIFGARFDNELLGGTLTADTSAALQALQDIANNGGTVSATNAAKLTAAGFGYVADANDVSGNNTPNGGGSYVGTSTTVAGATTTHIADATTTTSGNVDGNEHPTDNPASPMNNGFGVTFPAASSGTGVDGGAGGTPPGETPPATGPGGDPATPAPAFSDLGATFNDATRALEGGLWQNAVEEGGQGHGSIGRYTTDLTNVQTGLQAEVAAGRFTGDTLTHVNTVLADITTALSAATASLNGGGTFGSVTAAETALHTSHLDILNVVNNDPNLAALATQNGATGFLAAPAALPVGTTAANAPHANLAEIGTIFNDLANTSLGGFNADNSAQATADTNAIITDMQALMAANPLLFGGLTGIHADTVVRQLQLEDTYIAQAGVTPDAGRASNDNLLDIIDIVQGDTNLANMANQGGVSGFTPFGDALNPTPRYVDNDAQTNFWANFIAQSNSLGQRGIAAVDAHDACAITTLISDLHTFQSTVTNFDAAQGGIFEARFDNELLGNTSTLGAEVTAMIKGLQTGNAALVAAAAEEMHANSADVGGNNVPVTGGAYNADGTTVADVLSTAVAAPVVAAAVPAAATAPAPAVTPLTVPAPPAAVTTAAATHDSGGPTPIDTHQSHLAEAAHHFHHMWG
jgi:hypothetical protein